MIVPADYCGFECAASGIWKSPSFPNLSNSSTPPRFLGFGESALLFADARVTLQLRLTRGGPFVPPPPRISPSPPTGFAVVVEAEQLVRFAARQAEGYAIQG